MKWLAIGQVEAGAHVLDVNVGVGGVVEPAFLIAENRAVPEVVDVPICVDSSDPKALAAALGLYDRKALVNSVIGEKVSLQTVLPLVAQCEAAVIALSRDENGVSAEADGRIAVARKIIERADRAAPPVRTS